MEPGTYQLQVFISLIVILAAACVALICDYLKGNNEKLRELNIELKVRREEEQRRMQMLAPQLAAGVTEAPVVRVIAENAAKQWEDNRVTKAEAAPPRAWVGSKEAPRRETVRKDAMKTEPPRERKRSAAPEALAVMEQGAKLAGPRRSAPLRPAQTVAAAAASAPQGPGWNSLLERSRGSRPAAPLEKPVAETHVNESLLEAVMAVTAKSRDASALPAGFQPEQVLRRLVDSRQVVSGLVVSVGVHSAENARPGEVTGLLRSLLGPEDFAASSGENEFVLIFPSQQGAAAHRRLSRIAEQLWDFQLRSMGANSTLFSWGGVEVRGETIGEAMSSASERMLESQRGRKILTMARRADPALRRAV
jgi:hypothetical protein